MTKVRDDMVSTSKSPTTLVTQLLFFLFLTRVFSLGFIPTRILPPRFQGSGIGLEALQFRCWTHGRRRWKITQASRHFGHRRRRLLLLLGRSSRTRQVVVVVTVDDSHFRSGGSNQDMHGLATMKLAFLSSFSGSSSYGSSVLSNKLVTTGGNSCGVTKKRVNDRSDQ